MDRAAKLEELLAASREEVRRSSITSLPLKCKLADELDLPLLEVDVWMIRAYNRFRDAVKALDDSE